MEFKKLYTVEDVAKMTGLTTRTIRNYIKDGKLKGKKIGVQLYKLVEFELNKVNFNDLWKGFSKYEFALYNKRKVFLKNGEIPYDNRFLGNTSIDYDGRNLAIWYVEDLDKEDSRELASNI